MNSLAVRSLQLGLRGLPKTSQRFASGTCDPKFKKLKELQEKFQIPDGNPVHLKGGRVDKLMYHFTMGLCVVGVGMCVEYVYSQAVPKK